MAQQPNIEIEPSDRPSTALRPDAARRWTPDMRPGTITTPSEMPTGPGFGNPGPDTGWAHRLISAADLEDDSPEFVAVLAAIMSARAAAFGRAPTLGDLEAALAMCGRGPGFPAELSERTERWKRAIAHDKPPGATALAEVDRDLLLESPDRITSVHKLQQ